MKRVGVRPTSGTYGALIEACGRAGALQKAMMVLQVRLLDSPLILPYSASNTYFPCSVAHTYSPIN